MSIYDETNMERFTVHVLDVAYDYDPDNPEDSFELWHPASCPTEEVEWGFGVTAVTHDCLEAADNSDLGVEAFFRHSKDPKVDGREVLVPGRYTVRGWAHKYPATPDRGEEWDAGLELIPEVIP